MEVDTGASLSLMSQSTFRKLWPDCELQPAQVELKLYTVETLSTVGRANMEVRGYGSATAILPLLRVGKEGPTLLGRNWRLSGWIGINMHHVRDYPVYHQWYSVIWKCPKRDWVQSRFLKLKYALIHLQHLVFAKQDHAVPYAMRGMVEKDLERLIQLKISNQYNLQIGQLRFFLC